MGLFDTITPPTWEGATKAPTTQKQTLNWNPYAPKQVQSVWNPNQPTAYSGAEGSAIASLADIIKYGGYSPEQKQTMYGGMMAPVYQQGEEARRGAEADAYSRGLGQSSVLSRSYGDIDKQLMASGQQAMGQIEAQGAAQVMPAIGAVQTGQANLLEMTRKNEELQATLRQDHERLAAELNIHEGDLQMALNQINAAMEMSDADRQIELQRIINQFNLDATQIRVLQDQAKKDRWASFFSNVFGGAAEVAGGYLGGPLAAAKSAAAAVV